MLLTLVLRPAQAGLSLSSLGLSLGLWVLVSVFIKITTKFVCSPKIIILNICRERIRLMLHYILVCFAAFYLGSIIHFLFDHLRHIPFESVVALYRPPTSSLGYGLEQPGSDNSTAEMASYSHAMHAKCFAMCAHFAH